MFPNGYHIYENEFWSEGEEALIKGTKYVVLILNLRKNEATVQHKFTTQLEIIPVWKLEKIHSVRTLSFKRVYVFLLPVYIISIFLLCSR